MKNSLYECFPKHLIMGTAIMKLYKETEEERCENGKKQSGTKETEVGMAQGRLTINNRYMHREFKLKSVLF